MINTLLLPVLMSYWYCWFIDLLSLMLIKVIWILSIHEISITKWKIAEFSQMWHGKSRKSNKPAMTLAIYACVVELLQFVVWSNGVLLNYDYTSVQKLVESDKEYDNGQSKVTVGILFTVHIQEGVSLYLLFLF